jgi:hypothetical protein
MNAEAGGTEVPVTLHPIKDLIDVTIEQLSRATRTEEVERTLKGLLEAKASIDRIFCPSMFFNVTFK